MVGHLTLLCLQLQTSALDVEDVLTDGLGGKIPVYPSVRRTRPIIRVELAVCGASDFSTRRSEAMEYGRDRICSLVVVL